MTVTDHAWGVKFIRMTSSIDKRGYFSETFNPDLEKRLDTHFIADNCSFSYEGVIRGLHSQIPSQAKLVRCVQGRIIDVIVNKSTREFIHFELDNPTVWVFIPAGLYHGFVAIEDSQLHYRVDMEYNPHGQQTIAWNSPSLNIPWHHWMRSKKFVMSDKDLEGELI